MNTSRKRKYSPSEQPQEIDQCQENVLIQCKTSKYGREADQTEQTHHTEEPSASCMVPSYLSTSCEESSYITGTSADGNKTVFRQSSGICAALAFPLDQATDPVFADHHGNEQKNESFERYSVTTSIADSISSAQTKTVTITQNPNRCTPYQLEEKDMHVGSFIDAPLVSNDDDLLQAMEAQNIEKALDILKKADTGNISQDVLNTVLLAACRQGHKFLVQTLVRSGAGVQFKDESGFTPLLICVAGGFIDIARFLLKKGADVNTTNGAGDTALILSIRPAGSVDMTRLLLTQNGIDIGHENQQGYTALMKAIEAKDIDAIKLLINKQRSSEGKIQKLNQGSAHQLQNPVSDNERSAEQLANRVGLGRVVKLLQEEPTDSSKPLQKAAAMGDLESLNILIDSLVCDSGANIGSFYIPGRLSPSVMTKVFREHLKHFDTFSSTDIAVMRTLLANGADVNGRHYYDNAPIITATNSGSYEMVKLLCEYGADLTVTSYREGYDAMMIAAENGRDDLITLLIQFNGKVKASPAGYHACLGGMYQNSALDLALRNGHTSCAKLLLEHGAEMNISSAWFSAVEHQVLSYVNFLLNTFNADSQKLLSENTNGIGVTLLCQAVSHGNTEIVKNLLDSGCSINQLSTQGSSPLMEARTTEIVNLLIQRGADVNQRSTNSASVLNNVVLQSSCPPFDSASVVKTLLENGACVNDTDSMGRNTLMIAARQDRNQNVLHCLLIYGADASVKDKNGRTPLLHAIECDCKENAQFLIKFMSNPEVHCDMGDSDWSAVLMTAINHTSDVEVIKLLIDNGANTDDQDDHGDTALLLALASFPELEVLKALINSGSDVNHHNKNGESALIIAAQDPDVDVIELLVSSGANVNYTNVKNNQTALSVLLEGSLISSHADHNSCIEHLLQKGASSSSLSFDALHRAILLGHTRLIPKLIAGGLGPVDGDSDSLLWSGENTAVSPLCVALYTRNIRLARYLYSNLFLTKSDLPTRPAYGRLRQSLEMTRNEKCLEFLDTLMSQPATLFTLAFVEVSSAIGHVRDREERVNSLPLPTLLKDKLLFKREAVPLQVPEGDILAIPAHFLRQQGIPMSPYGSSTPNDSDSN